MNRYIIGVLACIGLAILLIILLFTGGHKAATPTHTGVQTMLLPDYSSTSADVKMVIDGPITAPQTHNSVVVTVSQSDIDFQLIQGYDGDVISSKIFNNSQNSFYNFLAAIYYAGYSDGGKVNYTTDAGLCALGERYDFYLTENGQNLQHYWATSCGGPKSYDGNLAQTLTLFQRQVPNYGQLLNNANI